MGQILVAVWVDEVGIHNKFEKRAEIDENLPQSGGKYCVTQAEKPSINDCDANKLLCCFFFFFVAATFNKCGIWMHFFFVLFTPRYDLGKVRSAKKKVLLKAFTGPYIGLISTLQ